MWVGLGSSERARSEVADAGEAIIRHRFGLCVWVALWLAATLGALADAPPQFGAATQLVLEPLVQADDGSDLIRMIHQLKLDDAQVQTELHLIRSERVLRYVFDTLDLADAPELSADAEGRIGRLAHWLDTLGAAAATPASNREEAFARFTTKVRARRIGLSYVIEIDYWAESPTEAARVANAVAAAYLRDRVKAAVARETAGPVIVRRRIRRLLGEDTTTTEAVRAGAVPDADLPDAEVRILGAPIGLVEAAFPHAGFALALTLAFAIVSGVLVIVGLRGVDRRVLSRRRLRALVGLDSLGRVMRLSRGAARQPIDVDWSLTLKGVWAGLVRGRTTGPAPRVGVLASSEGQGARRVAAGLLVAASDASWPAVARGAAAGEGYQSGAASAEAPMTIRALPPCNSSADIRAQLAACDAAVLVIEAERTTIAEVDVALAALRSADVNLAAVLLTR